MITHDVRALLSKANLHLAQTMEAAAGFTVTRGHYEVTLEHLLLKLIEDGSGDLVRILRYFEVEPGELESRLLSTVDRFRGGNSGRPVFSPVLLEAMERAFLVGAVEFDQPMIRSGTLLAASLGGRDGGALAPYLDLLEAVQPDELERDFASIVAGTVEDRPATGRFARREPSGGDGAEAGGEGTALAQFTIDFTQRAASGEIDPIRGRDEEIRQMVDILTRRRKNNPILVGEAGVGKTAVVEGLALRVAQGDVPAALEGVRILSLDLGLLQAGAGVKGEFENRLKSVIAEITESPTPIVSFIDEAHTLIGAGGQAGGSDAANLLKPALARGELRTVAATTWSEYKKYFEKDAALARRFQLVKVDEPDVERCTVMLRGIKSKFEEAHRVRILDSAVVAAVELSERFISGRQLPDKAVDLMDTAAARVKIGLSSKPAAVEDLERRIENAEIALAAMERDRTAGSAVEEEEVERIGRRLEADREALAEVRERWEREREAVAEVERARGAAAGAAGVEVASDGAEAGVAEAAEAAEDGDEASAAGDEGEDAVEVQETAAGPEPPPGGEEAASEEGEPPAPVDLAAALGRLRELQGAAAMVPLEVGPDVVATVVSDWTGIPAGKMLRDQAKALLALPERLGRRILGQEAAIESVARHIRAARSGMGKPDAPDGVFLFVGPSGVGKTECGLALADQLFGGERFLTSVNMSEYMEAHTVSRLIGSPPGYVGFGEGGVLTEAVRQRPYSVVLLDEVEKSHPDVMNLFYQVFDKGVLADGEGREIDFRNTVVLMTSNLASEVITDFAADEDRPDPDELVEAIRPTLRERFKPALLARMTIVPFYPLGPEVIRRIVDLKLAGIAARLAAAGRIELRTTPAVADWIAEHCTVAETGARDVDHVIQGLVLPGASAEILGRMAENRPLSSIEIDVGADGELVHRTQ